MTDQNETTFSFVLSTILVNYKSMTNMTITFSVEKKVECLCKKYFIPTRKSTSAIHKRLICNRVDTAT